MSKPKQGAYAVRIDSPVTDEALRKFALAVSEALTRLAAAIDATTGMSSAVSAKTAGTASLSVLAYNAATATTAALPNVKYVLPTGSADASVGMELTVSKDIGAGEVSGTAQGYMADYGVVDGAKLTAGMSANNEDPAIPRLDLGFKPKHGATLEFYSSDGGTGNTRAGQLRATLGPTGMLQVIRYEGNNVWRVIGGFGPNGEVLCGYHNYSWPTAALKAFNVYAQTGNTTTPVATIDSAGKGTLTSLVLKNGNNTATLQPTGFTGTLTFTVQLKTFQDGSTGYVLCAPAS